ncbi:MAG: tRNA A37 threonylcarbamoyladenosine biosynthesis protein TsaE, partial [Sulfurimonas sp.]
MANQDDIKKYLVVGSNPYFKQDNRNGEILMLSGVWGSGKTHFWKTEIEKELIKDLKKEDKSYVFISLYGKDSIEELQNEIYSLSYNLFTKDDNKVISSACSVFTKVASFMPKVSIFGIEVELSESAEKVEAEKNKQTMKSGIESLMNGGVICFDDFERKSSKIDLNDLFGFITNQEFFKERDSEVFSRIKEKSVNKFLLLNPTVEELFETIYKEKYSALDDYKEKILEAIKITEEKNARIF